jgi:hypothetical protein
MNLKALTENKTLVRNLFIAGLVILGLAQYAFPENHQSSSRQNSRFQTCCANANWTNNSQMQQTQDAGMQNNQQDFEMQSNQQDYLMQNDQFVNPDTSGAASMQMGSTNSSDSINTQNSGGEMTQPYNQLNDPDYIKSRENIQQQQRDLLGDTTTFVDSSSGQQYQVDQSASNAWADNSGNVVSSDTSASNPGASYTELQPLQTDTGTSTDSSGQ